MTQVSDRLASLSPSATLAMSQKSGELKAQGIDFINNVRIENAKKMFQDKEYMVYEVSEKTGFTSSQYFSKIFKEYTGLTPNQYRRKLLAGE